jgi:hypothetical protein
VSNQVHLYVSNLSSPQEVIDDDINEGNQHEVLLETQGDVPALLWIPLFKNTKWVDVLDKDGLESDDGADAEDYTLKMPIQTIENSIASLEDSEQYISKYFEENGGVKELTQDLIRILKNTNMKNIIFNPMCGDFDYSDDNDKKLIEDVLRMASGDMSVNKAHIVGRFSLKLENKKLFSKKPIIFERFNKTLYDSGKNTELSNLYSLIGNVDESL